MVLHHVLVEISLTRGGVLTEVAGQQRLRVREQVLLQLVFSVEPLVAHVAVERSLVYCPVLNQIRTSREFLVTQVACIGSVSEVKVLVLHEDVFVAETALADVALVWFLPDMSQPDVPNQAVLVAELLSTQRTLKV